MWLHIQFQRTVQMNTDSAHTHTLSHCPNYAHTHMLTLPCLHRPATYPAFYQVTKVGLDRSGGSGRRGTERGEAVHVFFCCCKKIYI